MAKEKVSKYAAKLRELGFRPSTEILSPSDNADIEDSVDAIFGEGSTKIPRRERRRLIKDKQLPCFSRSEGKTWAMDETCVDWIAETEVDLVPLGFTDNVAFFQNVRKSKMN